MSSGLSNTFLLLLCLRLMKTSCDRVLRFYLNQNLQILYFYMLHTCIRLRCGVLFVFYYVRCIICIVYTHLSVIFSVITLKTAFLSNIISSLFHWCVLEFYVIQASKYYQILMHFPKLRPLGAFRVDLANYFGVLFQVSMCKIGLFVGLRLH